MATQPTEFLALILRRADGRAKGRLKIWFYTVDQPGIGRPGPITDAVQKDVTAGWKPFLNLHKYAEVHSTCNLTLHDITYFVFLC